MRWTPCCRPRLLLPVYDLPAGGPSTARWSWADKAATRSSAAIPGIWWRTEQCIKGAIEGRQAQKGAFVVTYESIIPNPHRSSHLKPMLWLLEQGAVR